MDAPIGIFDSGLGGLTVFREISRLLPNENLIYVGDTARVPYGVKSAETVTRYSLEIGEFLVRHEIKALVVACNTASALALPQLHPHFSVPLLGVLEPGVHAAVAVTQRRVIGVIGTEGTVKSESYAKAIRQKLPEAQVHSRPCPLFVPLVEEGWTRHEVTRRVAEIYLEELRGVEVDTLILGCTHYPLLKGLIQEVMGDRVTLVDSALETAKALQALLTAKGLLKDSPGQGQHLFYTTDDPMKFARHAALFLGKEQAHARLTDLGLK